MRIKNIAFLQMIFLVAVALACIGSAAAQYAVYPAASSYYNPYGYSYPLSYNYRFGSYPYLWGRWFAPSSPLRFRRVSSRERHIIMAPHALQPGLGYVYDMHLFRFLTPCVSPTRNENETMRSWTIKESRLMIWYLPEKLRRSKNGLLCFT